MAWAVGHEDVNGHPDVSRDSDSNWATKRETPNEDEVATMEDMRQLHGPGSAWDYKHMDVTEYMNRQRETYSLEIRRGQGELD